MHRNVFIARIGIATLAAVVTAAVPAAALADPPSDQGTAAQTAPARKAAPAAQAGPRAGDRDLALTEDQKTRIRALREQHRAESQKAREGLRTARRTLADLRRAETFDETAFRAAAGAVAAAQADLMVQQARQRSQYRALLTPEQRARAAARREMGARVQRRVQALRGGGWNGPGSRRQGAVMGWGPGQMGGWRRGQGPGWGPGPMDGPQGPWLQGPGGQGWWGPGTMPQWRRGPRGPRPPAPGEPQTPAAPTAPAPPAPPKK